MLHATARALDDGSRFLESCYLTPDAVEERTAVSKNAGGLQAYAGTRTGNQNDFAVEFVRHGASQRFSILKLLERRFARLGIQLLLELGEVGDLQCSASLPLAIR